MTISEILNLNTVKAEIGNTNLNRFLVLDLRQATLSFDVLTAIAKYACKTNTIDDLVIIRAGECANFEMQIIGADGKEADFCVNGALYVLTKVFWN